ncbi:MAG: hypothetical protein ACKOC8_06460, partial [Pirellulales bacterium]
MPAANPVRHGIGAPEASGPTKREIHDQDVQGLKYLRRLRPLFSRLRKVGTERDRAGNRRLFMDHSCALILMSLFSPAIESLRDLQRACALDKVRKRLGVGRAHRRDGAASVRLSEGLPVPRRRTFAAGIMPAAHSMLTALRHPCLRWSATPATGHRQP